MSKKENEEASQLGATRERITSGWRKVYRF
jgi:hypothetical protein